MKPKIKLHDYLIEEIKIEFAKFSTAKENIRYTLPSDIGGDIFIYRHRLKPNDFAMRLTGSTKKSKGKHKVYKFSFSIVGIFAAVGKNISQKEKDKYINHEATDQLFEIILNNVEDMFKHTVFGHIAKPRFKRLR